MRIDIVRIERFRCLEDVTIAFDDVSTFIGPNGAGKSTVLRALDWFFNESGALDAQDVTFGHDGSELSVRVTFRDLSDQDRSALGRYAPPGAPTFTVWKVRRADGSIVMSANVKALPEFSGVRGLSGAMEKRKAFNALAPELGLDSVNSVQAMEAAMTEYEAAHIEALQDAPEELSTSFFGFNGANVMSGIFDYVFVPADMRAPEQVTDTRGSIIGRILERSVDRAAANADLAALAQEVNDRQRKIFEESFGPQLQQISEELTEAVSQFSLGKSIEVRQSPVISPAGRTQFDVSVAESSMRTTVGRQGHGFQRTLLIAALKLLAQQGVSGDQPGSICLAIEEPELFQHPAQAQAFSTVLRKLAEDPSQQVQICYATHSPHFIAAGKFFQVRRLTRPHTEHGPGSTVVASCSVEAVVERLEGFRSEEHVRKAIDSMATHRLPEALFAAAVLLVEGTSDRAVFEGMGDREEQEPLAVASVVVAEVGGKDAMLLPLAVLDQLSIPYFAVFDGDADLAERAARDGKDPAKIQASVNATQTANRALLEYLGEIPTEQPETVVLARCAPITTSLEGLLEDWPAWQKALEDIESAGITARKNHVAYRYATARANDAPPKFIVDVMAAARELA